MNGSDYVERHENGEPVCLCGRPTDSSFELCKDCKENQNWKEQFDKRLSDTYSYVKMALLEEGYNKEFISKVAWLAGSHKLVAEKLIEEMHEVLNPVDNSARWRKLSELIAKWLGNQN